MGDGSRVMGQLWVNRSWVDGSRKMTRFIIQCLVTGANPNYFGGANDGEKVPSMEKEETGRAIHISKKTLTRNPNNRFYQVKLKNCGVNFTRPIRLTRIGLFPVNDSHRLQ